VDLTCILSPGVCQTPGCEFTTGPENKFRNFINFRAEARFIVSQGKDSCDELGNFPVVRNDDLKQSFNLKFRPKSEFGTEGKVV